MEYNGHQDDILQDDAIERFTITFEEYIKENKEELSALSPDRRPNYKYYFRQATIVKRMKKEGYSIPAVILDLANIYSRVERIIEDIKKEDSSIPEEFTNQLINKLVDNKISDVIADDIINFVREYYNYVGKDSHDHNTPHWRRDVLIQMYEEKYKIPPLVEEEIKDFLQMEEFRKKIIDEYPDLDH